MPHYLLGVIQPTGGEISPEDLEKVMAEVGAVDQAMRDAGVWVYAGGLAEPGSTTVLRAQDGDVVMTDGPYAEGKEFLGGFTIVDVEDLDQALVWGRRVATAIGLPIEVRPFRW